MNKVIPVSKNVGQTPLDSINELKMRNSALQDAKLAYAGRLDPMAEGLLLVLVGDECKNRDHYQNLPKVYEFEVLFGIETDSHDVLGLPNRGSTLIKLENVLKALLGKRMQKYPPYSSARVDGKPLFYWARENKLEQIQIPQKEIEIYSLELLNTRTLNKQTLLNEILEKVSLVHGNFRQREIIAAWNEFFNDSHVNPFQIAKLRVSCSGGTYVRSIAREMGKKLGTDAIAYSIKRTQIGNYVL